jgi:hypothetical protein
MAWVSEPALSVTAEIRSEHILLLATLVLAMLVLATLVLATLVLDTLVLDTAEAEAVFMEALAHYRWPEPFQVARWYRVPYFRVRHSWAAGTLAASVCLHRTAADILGRTAVDILGRTAADILGRTAADTLGRTAVDMLGHTAHPDTNTSVYRTRATQLAATVPPARQRQER